MRVNLFVGVTEILQTRSVSHKRVLNTRSGQLDGLSVLTLLAFFLPSQIFLFGRLLVVHALHHTRLRLVTVGNGGIILGKMISS